METLARVSDTGRARASRLFAPVGTAAAGGAVAFALHVRDPHQHGSWGLCPFKALTGWDCPACGGLRAVNDLGHGQLLEAAHSNLLLVASIPLVVGLWALWLRRRWVGDAVERFSGSVRPLVVAYAVVAAGFTVYRNTPWGVEWYVA